MVRVDKQNCFDLEEAVAAGWSKKNAVDMADWHANASKIANGEGAPRLKARHAATEAHFRSMAERL